VWYTLALFFIVLGVPPSAGWRTAALCSRLAGLRGRYRGSPAATFRSAHAKY